MEPDLKALYESHYEQFFTACDLDRELDQLVVENFANPKEWYAISEGDIADSLYERVFEFLYDWDAEYLVCDPLACVVAYLAPRSIAK